MKYLTIAIVATLLTSCASVSNDMLNNQFPMIQAEAPPSDLSGIWTGAMASYLATIKIENDGTGLFCYSWGTANVEQKIKYIDGRLQIQDGTHLVVVDVRSERLQLESEYFTGASFTYLEDNDLSEASSYCASAVTN